MTFSSLDDVIKFVVFLLYFYENDHFLSLFCAEEKYIQIKFNDTASLLMD